MRVACATPWSLSWSLILAKLSGEDFLRGIAQWVFEHTQELAAILGLAQVQTPHYTTCGRILGHAVAVMHFEQITRDFFAGLPGAGQTMLIALDGKTLRGAIPLGAMQGVHRHAAYFPGEGIVMAQVEVGKKEIESGLRYRRDVTLHEDRCRVRRGNAPRVLAVINNWVLALFARLGYTSAPVARRHFAAHLDEAVNLILKAPN